MTVFFELCGLRFRAESQRALRIEPEFQPFLAEMPEKADIMFQIDWDWTAARRPVTSPLSKDVIQTHYREGRLRFCEVHDIAGVVSSVCYTPETVKIPCYINDAACPTPQDSLGKVFRLLPMRGVLLNAGVLFFHASRILVGEQGILFTAPSGTGKTTQARLWRDLRGAEILCNDRTLIRRRTDAWQTYGYPLDGSEPVRGNHTAPLGAVVLLSQATDNRVERLTPGKAVAALMSQLVIDAWDPEARAAAAVLLSQLLTERPVYHLSCTPTPQAVDCLEKILIEDGVLPHGDRA